MSDIILNNDPNDYYAKISPVYKYSITVGNRFHKNVLSAIFCSIFTMVPDRASAELFEMFNEASDANKSIEYMINKVIEIKDKHKLIFKTMPDIYSIITDIMCQRYRADEQSTLEQLIDRNTDYTFYDPTGLLGYSNTAFSMGLYNKFLHILATVGANECYVLQEVERF